MKAPEATPAFALAFPPTEIRALAERYVAGNKDQKREDRLMGEVGPSARARGHLTREEFLEICAWKSARSKPLVEQNDSVTVEAVTCAAFTPGVDALVRVQLLRALHGVDWPTATAILHLVLHDEFPLLDVRALESLQVAAPSAYSPRFVKAYVECCRQLAREHSVSLRTLDRALWQYSSERSAAKQGGCSSLQL